MKITIDADIPDRWVPHFCKLLRDMEFNGNIGSSRALTFYADGDGDFRPKFIFDGPEEMEDMARPVDMETRSVEYRFGDGDYFYDAG